jgi:hypothetical protein
MEISPFNSFEERLATVYSKQIVFLQDLISSWVILVLA